MQFARKPLFILDQVADHGLKRGAAEGCPELFCQPERVADTWRRGTVLLLVHRQAVAIAVGQGLGRDFSLRCN